MTWARPRDLFALSYLQAMSRRLFWLPILAVLLVGCSDQGRSAPVIVTNGTTVPIEVTHRYPNGWIDPGHV